MEWDEASKFPSEIIPKLAEMGLLGVIFPEKYGGAGMGYIEYAIVIEELSRVDGSIGIIVAAHNSLCTNHIYKFGSEEQKQKYVVPLAQGKKLGCWSLTEPEAGSDAGGTRTERRCATAMRWVTERLENVYDERALRRRVRGDGGDRRAKKSPRHFRVHSRKGNAGISPGQKRKQAGNARERHVRSYFHRLPRAARRICWAKRATGFVNSLQILDGGRISIAALALGMAQGAYEARCEYAKAAQTIRQSHRGVSGDPVQAGGHGDGD